MRYMLLLYAEEGAEAQATPEDIGRMVTAYGAYSDALQKAGAAVPQGMDRLQPTQKARTVRVRDGKTRVVDGPYADTKEQLGGFFIIDVADEKAALEWAERCPGAAHGSIEVRPLFVMPG